MTVLFSFKYEIIQKYSLNVLALVIRFMHILWVPLFSFITLVNTRIIMYILYLGWFIISLLTIFTICGLDFGAVLRFMMPKSELVNRSRIDNTMAKRKRKRTNNNLQNITHKTKDLVTRTTLTTGVNSGDSEG